MKSYVAIVFSGLLLMLLAGCAGTPNLPAEDQTVGGPGPSVLVADYKMAVGDEVRVDVWKSPELSVAEPIRPDGKIALPLIGDVMAAGRKPEELGADIAQKLSTYIKKPKVTVILSSLKGHEFLSRIRVTGSVAQNISIPYHQGMTVLDAVLEAGGVDEFANSNRTKLHRRIGDHDQPGQEVETFDIRLGDILEDGDMTTNILLLPGDIITVPERRF